MNDKTLLRATITVMTLTLIATLFGAVACALRLYFFPALIFGCIAALCGYANVTMMEELRHDGE